MAKTIGQLVNQAVEIRDERDTGDNTATRVGEMFIAIIEHLRDVSDVNSSNNGNNSSISLTGLLSSLSGMTDPDGNLYPNGAVLKYSGGAWGYDSYGGGTTTTTTGGGLTVAQLWTELDNPTPLYAANKVIPEAYLDLSNCIKTNATFWGNTINNNVVNGSLAGNISYIKFDYNNHTVYLGLDSDGNLRVSSDNGSGTANFYATGGVSALGYGSSGSGGNTSSESSSAPLDSNILKSINGFTASGVSNPSAGDLVYYSSNGWVYKKLGINDLTDVTISNLPSTSSDVTHVLTYDNTLGIWKNAAISTTSGASNLNGLSDVTISGISNANSYPVVLSKLRSTDTDFVNTPLSNLFAAGNGIDITTQTGSGSNNNKLLVSLKPAATGQIGGIQVFGTGSSSITPQSGTTTHKYYGVYLDGSNKAYVDVPWTDTNTTYSAGNGLNDLNGGTVFSVKAASGGGLAVDNTGIKIDPNTNKRVLWGNDDKLTNNIGSDITFDYGRGIQAYTTSNNTNAVTLLRLSHNSDSTHELDLGYGSTVSYGVTTQIYGVDVDFFTADVDSNGNVVKNAQNNTVVSHTASFLRGGGLAIGNGVLKWDSVNNALYVQKIDGTAANFYATGGVSALGFSNGISSIDAMTFNNLTVNNTATLSTANAVNLKATTSIKLGNDWTLSLSSGSLKLAKGNNDFALIDFNGSGELCIDGNAIQTS